MRVPGYHRARQWRREEVVTSSCGSLKDGCKKAQFGSSEFIGMVGNDGRNLEVFTITDRESTNDGLAHIAIPNGS